MRFEILGKVTATRDGTEIPLGTKTRLALATLLARPNRPVTVDALMDSLWEDEIPASGSQTLQWHVHQLRKRLAEPERITFDAAAYTIHVGPNELDALEFEDLLDRSGNDAAEFAALGRALELWRGDAFGSLADRRGVRAEARRLEQRRLEARERRGEAGLRLGEHESLIPELAELVRRFPERERFRALLMLALYRGGRRAEALEVYREAREHLVHAVGLEPGAELRELERAILNDAASLRPPPSEPETAPRSPAPAELPADIAEFTGRGPELSRVEEWLEPVEDGPAVVAIDGVGGMGKSCLAIRAAHLARPRFADGQLYINLHGATPDAKPVEPAEALARFLRSLGDTDAARLTNAEEMANRFRSLTAERRILIVLDDARDVAQVRPLLPSGAGCAVIVTGRRRLATLSGAHRVTLDRLPDNDSRRMLERIVGEIPPGDRDRIVEWCQGMPLALNICAARLLEGDGAGPSFVSRLSDARRRLSEMEIDDLAVRASFQVSYEDLRSSALGEDAARLFRLLGLHDGPDVGLAVAAALADTTQEDAERLLGLLIRARLVDEHRTGRYRSHDLIRLYARELVDAEEPEAERNRALRRMYVTYCATARACARLTTPGRPGPFRYGPPLDEHEPRFEGAEAAVGWVRDELANIAAAARSCPPLGDVPPMTLSLCLAVENIVSQRLSVHDGMKLAVALRDGMARSGDPILRAASNSILGARHQEAGRYREAVEHFQRAIDDCAEAGRPERTLRAVFGLATVHRRLGNLDDAERYADRALEMVRESDTEADLSPPLTQKAFIEAARGDLETAIATMTRSAESARDAGSLHNHVGSLGNIAYLQHRAGNWEAALRGFELALAKDAEYGLDGTRVAADHLWGLAQLRHDMGDDGAARGLWNEAADILLRRESITAEEHAAILATTPPPEPEALK